jgi:fibronectin-binding autotransporter adhesin
MANEYYTHTSYPPTNGAGSSALMRSELDSIMSGFAKLPTMGGNGSAMVKVNSTGLALQSSSVLFETGSAVGIGTSTPAYTLQVAGTFNASGAATFGSTLGVTGNATIGGTLGVTGNTTQSGTTTLTGNVGIGQAPSVYQLDVTGTVRINNGTNPYVALNDGTQTHVVQASSGNLNLLAANSKAINMTTGGSIRLTLDNAGNLGLNTATPASYGMLALYQASGALNSAVVNAGSTGSDSSAFTAYASGTTNYASLQVYGSGGGGIAANTPGGFYINSVNASAPILLQTNSTERFRVGPGGQLGIAGANYGQSGQVLVSKGPGAAPAWANSGGAVGAGADVAFVENDVYVTTSYTIGGASQNACTISVASPAVVTQTNTYVGGEVVFFTTTGALPTGLSPLTPYYVSSTGLSSSSFQVSATRGGASINTSGSQSGTQTCGKLKNASIVGPYVVATGQSVTIPTGARLVVN